MGLITAGALIWFTCTRAQDTSEPRKDGGSALSLFHPDPNHISNRLSRQVHTRVSNNGTEYGFEDLDPLLWRQTHYLLVGPPHAKMVQQLDEFLSTHAELQMPDPVKRAIFQRDLWAVFDWAAPSSENEDRAAREEIQNRLGPILRRLVLTKEELKALPNTYAREFEKKEFPTEYDPEHPEQPFLPPDLLDLRGSWVCIGGSASEPVALTHEFDFSRSAFFVFMRLPGGREPTLAYLKKLSEMRTPLFIPQNGEKNEFLEWNPAVPQFPAGTELALLAETDQQANLVLTPITESLQIRHYRKVVLDYSNPDEIRSSQAVYEFELDRAKLFSGEGSSLRAVTPHDRNFSVLMVQEDAFEEPEFAKFIGSEWPLRTISTARRSATPGPARNP